MYKFKFIILYIIRVRVTQCVLVVSVKGHRKRWA